MSIRSRLRTLGVILALLLLAAACSTKEEAPDYDEAFEKWRIMAEQAQGHSPSPTTDRTSVEHKVVQAEPIDMLQPEKQRPLPDFKISLRMHDADLVAVIQALSRAAEQSIVVSPEVEGTVNINIVQTPWDQVFKSVLAANKLTFSWEGNVIRVMTMGDMKSDLEMDVLRKQQQLVQLAIKQVGPLSTSIVRIKFADAAALQPALLNLLTKDEEGTPLGSIEVDENTNSLIIQGISMDMDKVLKVVANLDAPRAQVKLKAHIVETTKDTARALGVQWGGYYRGRSGIYGNDLYVLPGGSAGDSTNLAGTGTELPSDYNPGLGTGATSTGTGINLTPDTLTSMGANVGLALGTLGESILEFQLKALEEDNKLRIISSPSITTMDNQQAYTESGERVPYQTQENSGGAVTTSVEFEDAVLRLEITPHIIDDEYLKLSVLIKKDEVDTSRTVDGNPFIVKKVTETTLIARNGETVVISGLSKQTNANSEMGVPGLQDIPLAGELFKSEDKSQAYDEFLIFITPTVLNEWQPGERQKTMEEIEAELAAKREAEAKAAEQGEDLEDEDTGMMYMGPSGKTEL